MPITTDGLKLGLTAGARYYNLKELGWMPNAPQAVIKDGLYIICTSKNDMMNAHEDDPDTRANNGCFQRPDRDGIAVQYGVAGVSNGNGEPSGKVFIEPTVVAGNKVKSYLTGSCVLPIDAAGSVRMILFALGYGDDANHYDVDTSGILAFDGRGWAHGRSLCAENIPAVITASSGATLDGLGDMFMGIEINPTIPVTEGGFLTVKGYAAGVPGSDNFTYITLESSV